jgi:hypothetical protein
VFTLKFELTLIKERQIYEIDSHELNIYERDNREIHTYQFSMSEISKVYSQYHDSLQIAHEDHEERLRAYSSSLLEEWSLYLKDFVFCFGDLFANQIKRHGIRRIAEDFFGTTDVPFVAIDGSCLCQAGTDFTSFYGGAYGSRGMVSLSGAEGKLRYMRWEFSRDVSVVAFIPVPPEFASAIVEEDEGAEGPKVFSDQELAQVSSLHTKVMQLAEVYLAYTLVRGSTVESPRLVLMDNSISGMLANTSFSPWHMSLDQGDFHGITLTKADLQVGLAHPLSRELGVPTAKNFQPHFRLIAEAHWRGSRRLSKSDMPDVPMEVFRNGARFLSKDMQAGEYREIEGIFQFNFDPRESWERSLRVFDIVCQTLFRDKDPLGMTYNLQSGGRAYFTPRDIQYIIGVGLRGLIEECWRRRILLVGVVKDSNSRFFHRNYLGSVLVKRGVDPVRHLTIQLTDRMILELLGQLVEDLRSPWASLEFDGCFMTIHPEREQGSGNWILKGYDHPRLGETTRPERMFLRSLAQFLLRPDRRVASHVIFLDRLAHPGWDDVDCTPIVIQTKKFGEIRPLFYNGSKGPSRLQQLSMYLLTVLVRNHFPEALGYPDPLHKADWGAKSMRGRVTGLLESSQMAERSRPLSRTFRSIREGLRR